jgi:hypothetical protein
MCGFSKNRPECKSGVWNKFVASTKLKSASYNDYKFSRQWMGSYARWQNAISQGESQTINHGLSFSGPTIVPSFRTQWSVRVENARLIRRRFVVASDFSTHNIDSAHFLRQPQSIRPLRRTFDTPDQQAAYTRKLSREWGCSHRDVRIL